MRQQQVCSLVDVRKEIKDAPFARPLLSSLPAGAAGACLFSWLAGRARGVAFTLDLLQTKAEAAAAATKAKQPISHAQRSLAKVNKKGMKSISSFFGKK